MAGGLFELEEAGDEEGSPSIVLRVQLHPGPGRSEVAGTAEDALVLKVAAPARSSRGNAEAVRLVAELFGRKDNEIEVVSGESSAQKRLRVRGLSGPEAERLLDVALREQRGSRGAGRVPPRGR